MTFEGANWSAVWPTLLNRCSVSAWTVPSVVTTGAEYGVVDMRGFLTTRDCAGPKLRSVEEQVQSGAYGFRLVPADPAVRLERLVPLPSSAEAVRFAWRAAHTPQDARTVEDDRVVLAVKGHVRLEVRRRPSSVSVDLPQVPTPEAVVHPVATTPLALLARWRGDVTLHAGAVVHDGGAYAVCGGQRAGKSTMLALLARRGLTIAADDLVVVDRGDVLSGPSCVDLRPDAAAHFPEATSIGIVGGRERHRLPTPPAPARVPLRAIFLLDWDTDSRPRAAPLNLRERAQLIHQLDYAALMGLPDPDALLDLLALPMWRFTRSPGWAESEAVLDQLLATAVSV